MAKPRILVPTNWRQEDFPTYQALTLILEREHKNFSEWVREQGASYVKAHGDGNPNYTLEQFDNKADMKAYPTAWSAIGKEEVKEATVDEIDDMIMRLEKNLSNLKTIRQKKHDEEFQHWRNEKLELQE